MAAPGASPAATPVKPAALLNETREQAAGCRACHLWENATRAVFGEGNPAARIVLVGEQPGDMEDRRGRPFVGPAGRILDTGLEMAGIERDEVYVTNAVKHFKWTPRGKRRVHQRPDAGEIQACSPWLESELQLVVPRVVVCLGATAAKALLGNSFRVTRQRGVVVTAGSYVAVATVHPSSLLRIPGSEERRLALERFAADLRVASDAAR